jgi:hypothetical protein
MLITSKTDQEIRLDRTPFNRVIFTTSVLGLATLLIAMVIATYSILAAIFFIVIAFIPVSALPGNKNYLLINARNRQVLHFKEFFWRRYSSLEKYDFDQISNKGLYITNKGFREYWLALEIDGKEQIIWKLSTVDPSTEEVIINKVNELIL